MAEDRWEVIGLLSQRYVTMLIFILPLLAPDWVFVQMKWIVYFHQVISVSLERGEVGGGGGGRISDLLWVQICHILLANVRIPYKIPRA